MNVHAHAWPAQRRAVARATRSPIVLVAEDDPLMRRLLAIALARDGFHTLGVCEGGELEAWIRRLIEGARDHRCVDLVIADQHMPSATGLEALARLRNADWSTPFILIATFADDATRAEAVRLGASCVLDKPFEGFWMKSAYRIPDTSCGCIVPGTAPKHTVPVNRMTVRSFIISPEDGARLPAGSPATLKGIAFDGGYGIREVEISDDGGTTWRRAQLGSDYGRYSFREWSATWQPPRPGTYRLMVRAFNTIGESQDYEALWNPPGYLRNLIEHVDVQVA